MPWQTTTPLVLAKSALYCGSWDAVTNGIDRSKAVTTSSPAHSTKADMAGAKNHKGHGESGLGHFLHLDVDRSRMG